MKNVLCMRTVSDYTEQKLLTGCIRYDDICTDLKRAILSPDKDNQGAGCGVWCPLFRAANVPNVRHYGGLSRARM